MESSFVLAELSQKDGGWRTVARSPWEVGGKLYFSEEFIEECINRYSDVRAGSESSQGRIFNPKYLNVLDPIRHTNNLGRSVNVGAYINFFHQPLVHPAFFNNHALKPFICIQYWRLKAFT